jgi:hypothetical protein
LIAVQSLENEIAGIRIETLKARFSSDTNKDSRFEGAIKSSEERAQNILSTRSKEEDIIEAREVLNKLHEGYSKLEPQLCSDNLIGFECWTYRPVMEGGPSQATLC